VFDLKDGPGGSTHVTWGLMAQGFGLCVGELLGVQGGIPITGR
jgi:hypothetical protein